MAAPLSSLLLLLCSYCSSRLLPCLSYFDDHFFSLVEFLLSLTLAGMKTDFSFLFCFVFGFSLIDWLSGWVWGCFACLASLTPPRPAPPPLFFLVRRYNTEGFYVLDFPLSVTDNPKADVVCFPHTQTHTHTHFEGKTWRQPWCLHWRARFLLCVGSASGLHQQSHAHGGSTFWGVVHSRSICVNVKPMSSAWKDGWPCMMLIMWSMWCNVTERK